MYVSAICAYVNILRMCDFWPQNVFEMKDWASNKVFKGRPAVGTYFREATLYADHFLAKISGIKI
jgi:hypothetical protein